MTSEIKRSTDQISLDSIDKLPDYEAADQKSKQASDEKTDDCRLLATDRSKKLTNYLSKIKSFMKKSTVDKC